MGVIKIFLLLSFIQNPFLANTSSSCGKARGQRPCMYVPAKPGHTPACAIAGSTFCEKAGHDYPESLIKTLLKSYPTQDMITDETESEFPLKKGFICTYNYHFDHGIDSNRHHFHNYNNGPSHYGRGNNFYDSQSSEQGYQYPKPGHSSSSHRIKPTNFNYGDYYYQRNSREIHAIIKETSKLRIRDEFFKSIAPRNKRQISPNREQLCEIRTKFINPQAALNSRGNWMYIVNGEAATQLVKTETCASTTCSNLCQLPNTYNSRCEQKYVQKRLIALDQSGEKLYNDVFWFPSCCVCTVSNTS